MPDRAPYLYLTTRGRNSGLPREIEIWFTQIGGVFYIIAEYPTSQWVRNIQASPDVGIRVGASSFAATARILSPEKDKELHHAVQTLSQAKYGWSDGQVVELTPKKVTGGKGRKQRA